MIDSIKISQEITEEQLSHIETVLEKCSTTVIKDTGEINCRGYIRNLRVFTNSMWLNITGSIPKFYKGENVSSLSLKEVKDAFTELGSIVGLSLDTAIIRNFEIAHTFIIDKHPAYYVSLLKSSPRMESNLCNNGHNIYFSNDSASIAVYDKTKESLKKGGAIPLEYQDKNLIRLEWKQKKYIKKRFGRDLLVQDLYRVEVWQEILKKYKKRYSSIGKEREFADTKIATLNKLVEGVQIG